MKSRPLPVKVTCGRDDGAEIWIHGGYFEREAYLFVVPSEKEAPGVHNLLVESKRLDRVLSSTPLNCESRMVFIEPWRFKGRHLKPRNPNPYPV